jgi:uncharacterized integral membrane protein
MLDSQNSEDQEALPTPMNSRWHVFSIRKRSTGEWAAWAVWLIILIILFEYAVSSFYEEEPQAGVLAAALCGSILLAGIIIEAIKSIETRKDFDNLPRYEDD